MGKEHRAPTPPKSPPPSIRSQILRKLSLLQHGKPIETLVVELKTHYPENEVRKTIAKMLKEGAIGTQRVLFIRMNRAHQTVPGTLRVNEEEVSER